MDTNFDYLNLPVENIDYEKEIENLEEPIFFDEIKIPCNLDFYKYKHYKTIDLIDVVDSFSDYIMYKITNLKYDFYNMLYSIFKIDHGDWLLTYDEFATRYLNDKRFRKKYLMEATK